MVKTVSVVVTNETGMILALKRSQSRKWFPEKWDIISGKVETGEDPEGCFAREIFEEVGLRKFLDIKRANPFVYESEGGKWLVHPFLVKINHNKIKLNHEHSEFKWMGLADLLASDHAEPLARELKIFFDL